MSLLKLSGGPTGSGTVTMLAPNTNSTRTLTLPDEDGTILTNNSPSVGVLVRGAETATSSGTAVTLGSGLPSGIIRLNVGLYGVSTNNTSRIIVQFGTGSTPTYVTTGYTSSADNYTSTAGPIASLTNGFAISSTNAATNLWYVLYQFVNVGSNQWVGSVGGISTNSATVVLGGGAVNLGAELTAVRLTTTAGTGVFDGGSATIFYE